MRKKAVGAPESAAGVVLRMMRAGQTVIFIKTAIIFYYISFWITAPAGGVKIRICGKRRQSKAFQEIKDFRERFSSILKQQFICIAKHKNEMLRLFRFCQAFCRALG